MKKIMASMFILTMVGTSFAKNIASSNETSVKNKNSDGVLRSANSGSGFNPGNSGGSGYNPGSQKPSIPDESDTYEAGSGYNPGKNGGSGFNPGNQNPHIPDFVPDESITNNGNGNSGYNPGVNGGSGFNPGNQKPQIPDFIPDESITNGENGQSGYNPGVTGGSGFNPGNQGNDWSGESGFNPGYTGGSGFNPGNQGNDWSGGSGFNPGNPDESVVFSENGGSGFNPGANGGTGYNPGSPGSSGYNSGSKSEGRRKAPRNKTQFRTKIVFADDSVDDQQPNRSKSKSTLPPYQSGGEKIPFLRGDSSKQTIPFAEENVPRILLLQNVGQIKSLSSSGETIFQPLFQTVPINAVSAQTLPSPIQFAEGAAKKPYVPGQNKQQYLKDRKIKPYQANDSPAYILLNPYKQTRPSQTNNKNLFSVQTLPSPIQFDEPQENIPFSPQILVKNPVSGIFAQTLPSPIQFSSAGKQPYVPGKNKQQYLRDRQTKPYKAEQEENESPDYVLLNNNKQTRPSQTEKQNTFSVKTIPSRVQFDKPQENMPFSPQILVKNPVSGNFAQTIPSPIQFSLAAKKPYVPGQNKQQYLRGRQTKPYQAEQEENYSPAYVLLKPVQQTKPYPYNDRNIIFAQSLPSQFQYAEDVQTSPFLSSSPASRAAGQPGRPAGFLPGVSTKPSFPPGFTPSGFLRNSQLGATRSAQFGFTGNENNPELTTRGYQGPKTVLYIF